MPPTLHDTSNAHVCTTFYSVIIDPSFVERWLRSTKKASIAAHSLLTYRRGLLGLKLAAETTEHFEQGVDPLQAVLETSAYIQEKLDSLKDDALVSTDEENPSERKSDGETVSSKSSDTSSIKSELVRKKAFTAKTVASVFSHDKGKDEEEEAQQQLFVDAFTKQQQLFIDQHSDRIDRGGGGVNEGIVEGEQRWANYVENLINSTDKEKTKETVKERSLSITKPSTWLSKNSESHTVTSPISTQDKATI